uniref:Cytochrome P450 n=1 Tax=Parastrongyloides trichosuri TaxID=131310 RepID=A0A0N4Z4L9_PARTI
MYPFLFILSYVYMLFLKLIIWKTYWKKRNIPSPDGTIFFGHTLQLFGDFKKCDERWQKEFGETYGLMIMGTPDLTTTNMEIIKEVYVKQFENFTDRQAFIPESAGEEESLLTNGMFSKGGDAWRRIRNLCSPAFTTGKMKMFVKFFNESVDKTIEILNKHCDNDKEIDMKMLCDGMTLDSIFKSTFGYKADMQEDPNNIVRVYARKMFESDIKDPAFLFLILFPYINSLLRKYFGYHVNEQKEHNFFRDMLSECFERRKKELKENVNNEAPDFFKVLIKSLEEKNQINEIDNEIIFEKATESQKKKGMSKCEILAQGFLFLLAGYETTSNTLHFLLFMLAHHQEYQDKCREEIINALDGKNINYIDYETVNKLNYLEQCVKESLRMYPPAGKINRMCVKRTTINGIDFEPGTTVSVSIFNLHYNDKVYPEPEVYDPDRFSPEQKALRDPLYYLPFGYGPRNCIGMRYAYLSMKVYLARLLLKFKFVTCDNSVSLPVKINAKGMTKTDKELILKVERINYD